MLKIAQITLVEDNPADVFSSERRCKRKASHFELTCFENGEEALNSLSQRERTEPDIILLDLNLPMTEGVEVLRRIRSIPELVNIPVAILTSSASPADIHRTELLGVARYISKPIALDDLLREVGRQVEEMLPAGQ
jgi:two-component system response regulator